MLLLLSALMSSALVSSVLKQSQYSCPHCCKPYKRKSFYTKHVTLCRLLHNSSEAEMKEELQDLPNLYELYLMTKELGIKYNACISENKALKERVHVLESHIIDSKKIESRNKKNQNPLWETPFDYVSNEFQASTSFTDWVSSIEVSSSSIQGFLGKHTTDTLVECVYSHINESSPLRAFVWKKKQHKMFIHSGKSWESATLAHIESIIKKIIQTIYSCHVQELAPDIICKLVQNISYIEFTQTFFNEFQKKLARLMHRDIEV